MLPLTHGDVPDLALQSKMLMAFLSPFLDCVQLNALKLTKNEASVFVSLLKKATEGPHHLVDDFSLATLLKALISFTLEYHRQDENPCSKVCSDFEERLVSTSQQLRSNIELLAGEGLLIALKGVLKLCCEEEVLEAAMILLWCLAHDGAVKSLISSDADIVGALQQDFQVHQLQLASHCVLWLLAIKQDKGNLVSMLFTPFFMYTLFAAMLACK